MWGFAWRDIDYHHIPSCISIRQGTRSSMPRSVVSAYSREDNWHASAEVRKLMGKPFHIVLPFQTTALGEIILALAEPLAAGRLFNGLWSSGSARFRSLLRFDKTDVIFLSLYGLQT